jgi:hypothetical protein
VAVIFYAVTAVSAANCLTERSPAHIVNYFSKLVLQPIFTQMTGIAVKVLAQGTGQALDTGRRGDADVMFVNARFAELRFLAEGHGVKRFPVMYNDFVLVGPDVILGPGTTPVGPLLPATRTVPIVC